MGNFYTNYTLRGTSQKVVVEAMEGRKAVIARDENGCVVVFDEASDEQDMEVIAELASALSGALQCAVLAVLNHDDDILWYQLYESGACTDEYDSTPGYFDPDAEPSEPAGGDAERLCAAFGATDVTGVESALRRSSHGDEDYVFAFERHGALVRALGLPEFAVGTTYANFERGELPEGLSQSDVVKTG